MNREAALAEAEKILQSLRKLSYRECRKLMEQRSTKTVQGPDGKTYQLETQAFWDSKKNGNIRVMVLVDDGGISAFKPLTRSFIISPDGTFVGENID